jgi:hypothetical protein
MPNNATLITIGIIAMSAIVASAFVSYNLNVDHLNSIVSSSDQSVTTSLSSYLSTSTITTTVTTNGMGTITKASTIYPIPSNVTVLLNSQGYTSYSINAGSFSASGTIYARNQSFVITPVYQNENISINISLTNVSGPCVSYQSANVYLFVNDTVVSQANVICSTNPNATIDYTL